MPKISLKRRYDAFCEDARDLLTDAGSLIRCSNPKSSVGRFTTPVNLARIHFPEDKEINGVGPRGLLWDMYTAFQDRGKDADAAGARAVANTLKHTVKYRPPVQRESRSASLSGRHGNHESRACPPRDCPPRRSLWNARVHIRSTHH